MFNGTTGLKSWEDIFPAQSDLIVSPNITVWGGAGPDFEKAGSANTHQDNGNEPQEVSNPAKKTESPINQSRIRRGPMVLIIAAGPQIDDGNL